MLRRSSLLVIISVITSLPVLAHEGHGILHGHEPGHYLFSPEHALPVSLVTALLIFLLANRIWVLKKKNLN